MTTWSALESPLKQTLDPEIYVEQKDKDPASEDARQAAYIATIRRTSKAVRVFAIPNAGKRTRWEAAKVKREGLATGWPDTGACWADAPTAYIEFKGASGTPTPDQIETLNWLHRRGHPVAICRTWQGAFAWLRSVGAPINA